MMKVVCQLLCLAIFALSLDYTNGETRYCNEGLGECTKFYACSNATTFDYGAMKINVRFNVEMETDACHYLEMCCDPEDVIDVIEPPIFVKPLGNVTKIEEGNQTKETTETLDGPFTDHPGPTTSHYGRHVVTDHPEESYPSTTHGFTDHPTGSPDKNEKIDPVSRKTSEEFTDSKTSSPVTNTEDYSQEVTTKPTTCDSKTHSCVPFFYCAVDTTTDGADLISSRSDDYQCAINSQVCCDHQHNILHMTPKFCGSRNKEGIGYQVTNSIDEAQYAEFPWMAALSLFHNDNGFEYICGGSLIHPHVVLTGAHCVYEKDFSAMNVRLGEWDTQTTYEILPESDHLVEKVITHADFGPANLFNDVALLVLKTAARLSVHINTICLPPQNFKFDRTTCFASGWGADKFGREGIYRVNLKKIQLPIVPLKECQDSLRSTKLGPRFKIHQGFMCAGGEKDIDTCTGDGGSPLVCSVDGKNEIYYQAGIVAWGIECGQQGIPGVYASVAKYRHWIDQQMNDLGYGTASYTIE